MAKLALCHEACFLFAVVPANGGFGISSRRQPLVSYRPIPNASSIRRLGLIGLFCR